MSFLNNLAGGINLEGVQIAPTDHATRLIKSRLIEYFQINSTNLSERALLVNNANETVSGHKQKLE
jgi:hypothetical protein